MVLMRGAWVLAMLAVTVLALLPVEHLQLPVFDWWDKAQHTLAFTVLTAWALLLWPASRSLGAVLALCVLLVATSGIVMNLLRGRRDVDCGCSGLGESSGGLSWWLVARNALLAALAAPWLMRIFTRDPVIIAAAQTLLWLSVLLEIGRVLNLVVPGALRASGDIHFPLLSGIPSQLLVLGLGSYLLGRSFGLPGIWLAYVADECLRGGLMWWRWRGHGWLPYARNTLRALRQGNRS